MNVHIRVLKVYHECGDNVSHTFPFSAHMRMTKEQFQINQDLECAVLEAHGMENSELGKTNYNVLIRDFRKSDMKDLLIFSNIFCRGVRDLRL